MYDYADCPFAGTGYDLMIPFKKKLVIGYKNRCWVKKYFVKTCACTGSR